jgi:hypothetical protein
MPDRRTQEERILAVLSANFGRDVPLPEILALRIAQYNARIKGLRSRGYDIRSRSEWEGRERHTWFRLVGLPGHSTLGKVNPNSHPASRSSSAQRSAGSAGPTATTGVGQPRNASGPAQSSLWGAR